MEPTTARWSVADYHAMQRAGVLADRRVELLAGDIVAVAPEGPEHAVCGETLAERLRSRLGDRAYVREAHPITLANSEPEPDVAVVRGRRADYRQRHPGAEDVLLVIEVSDSTLRTDLGTKRDIYAAAGIPEYWVLDLNQRQVTVFRDPQVGEYRSSQTIASGSITPLAFPDCKLTVAEMFA